MTTTIIANETDYAEVVREAEDLMRQLLAEPHEPLFATSFAQEVEELAREIEGADYVEPDDVPGPEEEQERITLVGVRGDAPRAARERIEALLDLDRPFTGHNFPRQYGAEILSCARWVKRTLDRVEPTGRGERMVPGTINLLSRIIADLETTPSDDAAPREDFFRVIKDNEARLLGLLEDPQLREGEKSGPPTLYGLRGSQVRTAKKVLIELQSIEPESAGLDDPRLYTNMLLEAANTAKEELEIERDEGVPSNQKLLPGVIAVLDEVSKSLRRAEKAFIRAQQRQQPKPTRAKHFPHDAERGKDLQRWSEVLSCSLDLLDRFQHPHPAGSELTASSLASLLTELADQQPQLQLRETVIDSLDDGDLSKAWVELHDLVERYELGQLSF